MHRDPFRWWWRGLWFFLLAAFVADAVTSPYTLADRLPVMVMSLVPLIALWLLTRTWVAVVDGFVEVSNLGR